MTSANELWFYCGFAKRGNPMTSMTTTLAATAIIATIGTAQAQTIWSQRFCARSKANCSARRGPPLSSSAGWRLYPADDLRGPLTPC